MAAGFVSFTPSSPPPAMYSCPRKCSLDLAASWEALFTYDTLLFVLTVSKTWRARHRRLLTRTSIPIVSLVLRDGMSKYDPNIRDLNSIFLTYQALYTLRKMPGSSMPIAACPDYDLPQGNGFGQPGQHSYFLRMRGPLSDHLCLSDSHIVIDCRSTILSSIVLMNSFSLTSIASKSSLFSKVVCRRSLAGT